jgi:hypothetical protein
MSKNNRANVGNQSSRHQHLSDRKRNYDPGSSEHRAEQKEQMHGPEENAHEYYPDFDDTGAGVNPRKPIERHK